MLLIQITAAQGPAECELAVRLTLLELLRDAERAGVQLHEVQAVRTAAGYKSVVLQVRPAPQRHARGQAQDDATLLQPWLQSWLGSIQWVFASPLRPGHRRKNWFVAVQRCPDWEPGEQPPGHADAQGIGDDAIVFTACRAAGKGGQHVNTTASAVHAVHQASGIAVKVMAERSQHANKKLARALIALRLAERAQAAQAHARQARAQLHWRVDRGNPVRVFHPKAPL